MAAPGPSQAPPPATTARGASPVAPARIPGPPTDAPIGGQAVLEGVMMRGVRTWAVAIRKPTDDQLEHRARAVPAGGIEVKTFPLASPLARHRWLRLPIVRGVVALGESLAIGIRALGVAAAAQLPEDEQDVSGGVWIGTIAVALVFAVGLFFVAPVGLASLIKDQLHSATLFWLVEGVIRTAIFLGYLLLLSRLRELRRVFEYHGAEHKTIHCYEAGEELTPESAQRQSRLHPRCGTSFLLFVMIIAIFVFAPLGLPAWYWLVATRILGIPLIAGLSYEVIRFAGRHRRRRWVQILMSPGLALQRLTTREPGLDQLAVAIAALGAVLDEEAGDRHDPAALIGLEVVA
ncbi:MAG: hypothetical protein QOE27_2011 [Solirubrobacteraceae bacterium]|nr:hypothetical protein [Solirubrobacteraceae bacterium]